MPRGDLLRFAALAITGYGAASVCYFFALKFADAAVVAVLLYAYPAFVTLASWVFLGEKASWQRGAAVLVTFLGCALVVGLFGGSAQAQWQGIVLGLGAALGYTLFNLLSHRWLPGRSQLVMMTYTFGIASLMAAGLALGVGQSLSPAAWEPSAWWLIGAIVRRADVRGRPPLPAGHPRPRSFAGSSGLDARAPVHDRARERLPARADALTSVQLLGAGLVLAGVVWSEVAGRSAEPLAAV